MDYTTALIQTKLHRPPLPIDLVPRPRLTTWLDQHHMRPLTLISAPAGYGKSTVAKCWVQSLDGPQAWVSLDEHDDDLVAFLNYFLAAIQTIFPEVGEETKDLLAAAPLPPRAVISRSPVNQLARIDTSFVLVLDDYHKIHEPAIHDLISELLHYPPPGLRLVLCTRNDPPLPLVKLRAQGQLSEIRAQDLRFTKDETSRLLEIMLGAPIDEATLASLELQTEGWVTGLRLAALALRHQLGEGRTPNKLTANNPYIAEYLVAEILAQQLASRADCMLKLAVLERFNADLCEAVCLATEAIQGRALLEWMQTSNLFVIPLDNQRQWFRFQHLFRDFLLEELARKYNSAEIASLHQRASHWFAENGLLEEALYHALAAGEIDRAVQLATRQRYPLMNGAQWQWLEQLLRKFSPEMIERYPELLMLRAWLIYHSGRFAELPAALQRVEAAVAQTPMRSEAITQLEGEISALRSFVLYFALDVSNTLTQTQEAIAKISRELWIVHILARMVQAGALQMTGNLAGAYAAVAEAAGPHTEEARSKTFKATLLAAACNIYGIAADLLSLRQAAEQCAALGQNARSPEIMKTGHYHLGRVYYDQNNLSAAEEHFALVVNQPYLNYGTSYLYGACGLAQTYQAQGRAAEARNVIGAACTFFLETDNSSLLPAALTFQVDLALQQGQIAAASQWAARIDRVPPLQPIFGLFSPHLTLVKIWLAENTTSSRERAASLLDEMRAFVEATHNTRFLIETLALQALLSETEGQPQTALDTLEQAIILAQPGGFIRLFVDLGPQLIGLLEQLQRRSAAPDYIELILAAADKRPAPVPQSSPIVESLTDRETEVLSLLAQRLTNKEIAERLHISPSTVKSHTLKIYQKLEVSKRRHAVKKAIDLGILPHE